MKNSFLIFASLICVMVLTTTALGADRFSVADGNWGSTSTWSTASGGASGASEPGASDNAIVEGGFTVTLDAGKSATNVTVKTGSTLNAAGFILSASGAFTLEGGGTFKQGGTVTTVPGGSQSFATTSTYIFNGTQSALPAAPSYGNLTWSATNSTAAIASAGLTVTGTLTLLNSKELRGGAGTRTHTVGGSVVVDGSTAVLATTTATTGNTGTWNITGGVTTANGGIFRDGPASGSGDAVITIGGNIANNGTFDRTLGGNLTLSFNGSSAQTVSGNAIQATNITINNGAGVTFNTGTNPTVSGLLTSGTLTLTNGALNNNSATLTMEAGTTLSRNNSTSPGGSLTAAPTVSTTVKVVYTGSSSITTGPELPTGASGLDDLTINNSAGVVLNAAATINGNLVFTNGKLTLGSNNLTLGGGTSTITGATSSNYVVTNGTGYLIGNVPNTSTDITFPVGTSSTYNPAILNNSGIAATDNYSVRVASGTANVVSAAGVVSRQWTINEASAAANDITLTLQWNSSGEEGASITPGNRSSLHIGKYTGGTNWDPFTSTVSGSEPYTVANNTRINPITFSNTVFGVGLPGALPVELTSFTATPRNAKVELAWATATEINNYGFEVERSVISNQLSVSSSSISNRQSAIGNWEKVGFVEGHGTTNAPQNYSFTDAAARVGKFSYRLKQIDRDGKFEYHQAVEVTLGISPNTVWLDNNYPNPFNPSTKISFVLGTTGNASLKVFDLLGKEVVTLADGIFNSGELQSFTFDASKHSSGIYYYQLKSGTQTEMKKMLLLK